MATIQHSVLTGSEQHEPKGVETAASGQVYVANGDASSGTWTSLSYPEVGWWDYNDLTTATTPIAVPTTTWTALTNDGAGAQTQSDYALSSVTNIWDTSTNRLDFTDLEIGDTFEIRIDAKTTTTTANQVVQTRITFGEGSGTPYTSPLTYSNYKSAGTYELVRYTSFYIGNTLTKDNPALIEIYSDAAATVEVVGWFIKVTKHRALS